jgi:hypothetical protein
MAKIYRLICDDEASDRHFAAWQARIVAGADVINGTTFWRRDLGYSVKSFPNSTDGKLQIWLGNDPSGQHWVVQVNAPTIAGDGNSLAAIGEAEDGELVVVRQGRLHPNTTTLAQIKGGQFSHAFGVLGVPVKVCSGPRNREWFRVSAVADMKSTTADTAEFVRRCVDVRAKCG